MNSSCPNHLHGLMPILWSCQITPGAGKPPTMGGRQELCQSPKSAFKGRSCPQTQGPLCAGSTKWSSGSTPRQAHSSLFFFFLFFFLLPFSANLTAMHVSMHCQDIMHYVLRYTIISRLKLLVSVCCHNTVCICRGYPDVVICLTRSICYAQCALVSFPANMNSAIIAELASCLRRGSRAMTP